MTPFATAAARTKDTLSASAAFRSSRLLHITTRSTRSVFALCWLLHLWSDVPIACRAFRTPSSGALSSARRSRRMQPSSHLISRDPFRRAAVTTSRGGAPVLREIRSNGQPSSLFSSPPSHNDDDDDDDDDGFLNRRSFLSSTFLSSAAAALATDGFVLGSAPEPAFAGSLIQFPCIRPLKNRYHFMRAGTSELEAEGIWSTNPLFLTNRENCMVDDGADKIISEACEKMMAAGQLPTVVYHSLAANGIDTADQIGRELNMGRDRILPEFTYLDGRGIGLWDSGDAETTRPAVWAMDAYEAGKQGTGGRPPPNEDGTPNETLADQFVRLRQFLSLQESRTSGENMLLIFPDGTGPALLSAMIAGIPLNDVHSLEYAPGEVRLDITRDSVLEQYAARKDDPNYLAVLEDGKQKLSALRAQKGDVVNLKEQKEEEENAEIDRAFLRKKQIQREEEQKAAEEQRSRKERELQAAADAKEARRRQQQQLQGDANAITAAAEKSSIDEPATGAAGAGGAAAVVVRSDDGADSSSLVTAGLGIGAVGIGAAAVAAGFVVVGDDDDDESGIATSDGNNEMAPQLAATAVAGGNATATGAIHGTAAATAAAATLRAAASLTTSPPSSVSPRSPQIAIDKEEAEFGGGAFDAETPLIAEAVNGEAPDELTSSVEEELNQLEEAQLAMDMALMEEEEEENNDSRAPASQDTPRMMNGSNSGRPAIQQELDNLERAHKAMDQYLDLDDGAGDWLRVLAEIRDEPDEDDDIANIEYVNGDGPGGDALARWAGVPLEFPED